jgi:hypothetical protein
LREKSAISSATALGARSAIRRRIRRCVGRQQLPQLRLVLGDQVGADFGDRLVQRLP